MAPGIRTFAWITAFCALTGCAANDLMLKRQAEVEAKVEHLIQADKKNLKYINEQAGQAQDLTDQIKVLGAQLKQVQESLLDLRNGQDEFKTRLNLLAQPSAT